MYKKKSTDHVVHLKKFLSHGSDSLRRLKALRNELEKVSVSEAKQITEEYCATVFYVIYTSFTTIEAAINERVSKGRAIHEQLKELKDVILPSLERIIILLPEKIQQRWEYNSLCLVIRKLLHPDNSLELRQYGIKLLVLWLQALQDNCGDAAIELFASAVPYFPPKKTPLGLPDQSTPSGNSSGLTLCNRYGIYSKSKSDSSLTTPSSVTYSNPMITGQGSYTCISKNREWVATKEIQPLSSGTSLSYGVGTDSTLDLMDYLLNCLTSQVGRLKWVNNANHIRGFSFLFFQFKLFYLACLYKNFRSDAGLYLEPSSPVIEIPSSTHDNNNNNTTEQKASTQSTVSSSNLPKHSKHPQNMSAVIKLDYDTSDPIYTTIRQLILKFLLKWIMSGFHSDHSMHPSPPTPSPGLNPSVVQSFIPKSEDMMRDMWMTSKDNVNLLFEICHQGFKLPMSHFGYVNKLTQLYLSWVQDSDKPLFMRRPLSLDTIMSLPAASKNLSSSSELSIVPWEIFSGYSNFDCSDVRAGSQHSLRMFISHTRQLFLHDAPTGMISNQVDSGKKIIKFYQEIMSQWSLDLEGWIYLLKVILHLCLVLLKDSVPPQLPTLGTNVADILLQTLLVGYVRASMCYELPVELWDNLMEVLSYLTGWIQVVSQWTEILNNLTHCLSKVVYNLDLDELPLNQNDRLFRPRTNTIAADTSFTTKKKFTDIKPEMPRITPLSNKGEFMKAVTFDSGRRTSTNSSPEDRRFSTPAKTLHSQLTVSSALVTKREMLKHQPVIEEASCDIVSAETHLIREDSSTGENENLQLSLVISNEDVSSEKEEELQEVNHTSNNYPIKRSMSESVSLTNSISGTRKPSIRSLSPDITKNNRTISPLNQGISAFTEFIPKPSDTPSPPTRDSPKSHREKRIYNHDNFKDLHVAPKEGQWNCINVSQVWYRVLRSLGDINNIKNPIIHASAMKCLAEVWKHLQEIEKNSGVSLDNEATPILPPYLPPVMIILPWIVKACGLPSEYQEGRNIAYLMLCDITLRHVTCTIPPNDFLPHFYRLMHQGLRPTSDVLYTAIKGGARLLSFGLDGMSVLYRDVIDSCSHILDTKDVSAPRTESLTLLGDLYYLSYYNRPDIQELVTELIFHAAISDPLRQARCLALFQVGMICMKELSCRPNSNRIVQAMDILLASLKFPDQSIVLSSVDMLSLLTEQINNIEIAHPTLHSRIIQAITSAAASQINTPNTNKKIKMLISILLCLRDWTIGITINQLNQDSLLSDLLEVLHAAAAGVDECKVPESPVVLKLEASPPKPYKTLPRKTANNSTDEELQEQLQIVSKSIVYHLLNLIGHFPFPCGAAQMSSIVCEYHDCPSLEYLEELSSEMFDSPRVQFFSLNNEAVITFIEIPIMATNMSTDDFLTASYHCRIIIRDVTGRYCWDSTVLFGPKQPYQADTPNSIPFLSKPTDSTESLCSGAEESDRSSSSLIPDSNGDYIYDGGTLKLPSWRTESSSIDHLQKLLCYMESSSSECILYPEIGLTEPSPSVNEPIHIIERKLQELIDQQNMLETDYISEASHFECMKGLPAVPPDHCMTTFAFHYCHLFLSHMGYLSWNKRNSLDLLNKSDQLIRGLKHLDDTQTQCRQTYKVAVLYISCGQEDRQSILLNSKGSRPFEEFVSGLGWEVDMSCHLGYSGGLKRSYSSNCTMPYYATPSEEILFHVSTRMPSSGTDIEQKVRHLGNDEVHIIWSEHWRDYRRNIFKTQFADILIIIYPLPNQLYRIQIERKNNNQFGPLFDGAVIDGNSLASLVRATAINALRSQRSPFFSYRGRYQDRWKYIQDVVNMKMKSSFEDFSQSIMHPLESGIQQSRQSPVKMMANISAANLSSSLTKIGCLSETRWSIDRHQLHDELLPQYNIFEARKISDTQFVRPRSRTTDDSSIHFNPQISKNNSVPDNLCDIGCSN